MRYDWAVFGLINILFVSEQIVLAEGKASKLDILFNCNAVYKSAVFVLHHGKSLNSCKDTMTKISLSSADIQTNVLL